LTKTSDANIWFPIVVNFLISTKSISANVNKKLSWCWQRAWRV